MKLAFWFWIVLLLSGGGLAFYFFGDHLWTRPPTKSLYAIQANHVHFKFSSAMDHDERLFRIDWPPKTPAEANRLRVPPLLNGRLDVSTGDCVGKSAVNVRIELTRGETEADRERWNRQLAFPEYDWMSRVRVWDADRKWLWPNLPYLLRADGIEREQRYGGVDPGKGVDNDFAAVVVRPLGALADDAEVTAKWFGPPTGTVDKRTIVHRAFSQDLQWNIPAESNSGVLGVWLIYADFLESPVPEGWPAGREFNGGALAFFSIHWAVDGDGKVTIGEIVHDVPPVLTGVDWQDWLRVSKGS